AIVEVPPESARESTVGGASIRVALHRGRIGASLAVAGVSPSDRMVSGVPVRIVQIPFDAGLRIGLVRRGRTALWGDFGISVPALGDSTSTARGITQPGQDAGPDLGFRLALEAQYDVAPRWWLYFTLQARVIPVPDSFEIPPRAELGSMPHLWVGLSAG